MHTHRLVNVSYPNLPLFFSVTPSYSSHMMPVERVVHQTVVSVRLLVRVQPVDSGCLSSDMTVGSEAGSSPIICVVCRLFGGTWLPSPPFLARSMAESVPAQRPGVIFKGLQPTSCHLVFCFGQRAHFLSTPSTLHGPSQNRLRTWSPYSSSL